MGRLIQTNTSYVTILCGLSVCRRKPIRIFPSRELLEQKNTIYIRANYRASRFVRVKSCTYTIETRTGKRGLKRFLYLQILVQVQARARWIGGAWMDEKEECGTVRVCVCVCTRKGSKNVRHYGNCGKRLSADDQSFGHLPFAGARGRPIIITTLRARFRNSRTARLRRRRRFP